MNFGFVPAGPIAAQERGLIVTMVWLMLIVVVPMFVALFTIARRYRIRNEKRGARTVRKNPDGEYDPELRHGAWAELIMWAIPAALVGVLGTLCWQYAHAVDPSRAITAASSGGIAASGEIAPGTQPLTIQVVALPWKWLFIYPAEGIATVNFIEFPERTPIRFELTADGPMSSFWIPQLGSQIYAMAAMETQINLLADAPGDYVGKDTEINGDGYASMQFNARAVATQGDFDAWVAGVKGTQATGTATLSAPTVAVAAGYPALTEDAYNALAAPSENNPVAFYSSFDPNLFSDTMMKYMMPMGTGTEAMMGMSSTVSTTGMATSTDSVEMMPGMRM